MGCTITIKSNQTGDNNTKPPPSVDHETSLKITRCDMTSTLHLPGPNGALHDSCCIFLAQLAAVESGNHICGSHNRGNGSLSRPPPMMKMSGADTRRSNLACQVRLFHVVALLLSWPIITKKSEISTDPPPHLDCCYNADEEISLFTREWRSYNG